MALEALPPGLEPVPQAAPALPPGLEPASQDILEARYGTAGEQLKTFGEGALSTLTLGFGPKIEEALGADPTDILAREKQNPFAHGAGAVAGAVAPMLVPGLGEATAPGLLAKLGAGAAKGIVPEEAGAMARIGGAFAGAGLEGLGYSAADEIHDAILGKDPDRTAGQTINHLLFGALLGGTVGAAGKAVGEALDAGSAALHSRGMRLQRAEEEAFKREQLGIPKGQPVPESQMPDQQDLEIGLDFAANYGSSQAMGGERPLTDLATSALKTAAMAKIGGVFGHNGLGGLAGLYVGRHNIERAWQALASDPGTNELLSRMLATKAGQQTYGVATLAQDFEGWMWRRVGDLFKIGAIGGEAIERSGKELASQAMAPDITPDNYHEMSSRINTLATDPTAVDRALQGQIPPGVPTSVQRSAIGGVQRMFQHLSMKLPQTGATPVFDVQISPSPGDLADANTAIRAMADPLSVVKALGDGTYDPAMGEALLASNPAVHAQIKQVILEGMTRAAAEGKVPTVSVLRGLEEFTGQDLGTGGLDGQFLLNNQTMLSPPPPAKPSGSLKTSMGQRTQTEFQKTTLGSK